MDSRRKSHATKRLGRIGSNDITGGILGQKSHMPVVPSRWQFALLSCGSNAFGQINQEDIMCSTVQVTQIPGTIDGNNGEAADILSISSGSQITAAIVPKHGVYMWGSGIGSFRVPTLLQLPDKVVVSSISCGQSHAAMVTSGGKVLTWGSGEHGALGHGTKTAVSTPKLVKALASLVCVSVSCGAYNTAFIAGDEGEVSYLAVPPSASGDSCHQSEERSNEFLACASLYTCGVGKAGQLGMGLSLAQSRSPRLVTWFGENGFKVARVSCGMHHMLAIGVPVHAMRMFTTTIFSFGWGEHGRLGLGNEDNVLEPTQIAFPEPFHAVDISAGEQHSLATSGRIGGCYAWGSNEFGQCGAGSPSQVEHCLVPTRVPVPEGLRVSKVAAGGRHSAAISTCGQLLLWGWGEEGQLGNGSEKDSFLPRPCRVPAVYNSPCVPVSVSLGMCHTVVLVKNTMYRPATPPPAQEEEEEVPSDPQVQEREVEPDAPVEVCEAVEESEPEEVVEPLHLPPAASPIPMPSPQSIELKIVDEPEAPVKKEALMVEEVEEEVATPAPVAIRSLRDILTTREERREKPPAEVPVVEACVPEPPVPLEDEEREEEEEVPTRTESPPPPAAAAIEEATNEPKRRGSGGNMVQYFYKDGQNLDNCFVANSAKRAELRKQKKQTAHSEQAGAARVGKVPAVRPPRKMSK